MTTLLLAEHDNKSLKDATNKALSAAKQMGGDVHVLVAGSGAKQVADAAAKLDGLRASQPGDVGTGSRRQMRMLAGEDRRCARKARHVEQANVAQAWTFATPTTRCARAR